MDIIVNSLRVKESKGRAESLGELLEKCEKNRLPDGDLAELGASLANNIVDNNVKVSSTACQCIEKLCEKYPDRIQPYCDVFLESLIEILGNAKPQIRDQSKSTLLSLMALGDCTAIVAKLGSKGFSHKNWRVREGVLHCYSRQVTMFQQGAAILPMDLLSNLILCLNDAQPDVRKAAIDTLSYLAIQIGLPRVITKVEAQEIRPALVNNIKERYTELSTGSNGAPLSTAVTVPTPTPVEAVAATLRSKPSTQSSAPTATLTSAKSFTKTDSLPFSFDSTDEPSLSVHPSLSSSPHPPLDASIHLSEEDILSHPVFLDLVHFHSGPWWKPGVLGDPTFANEAFTSKPVLCSNARDIAKCVDDICAACSTTTADWKNRSAGLEKLRGLLTGGVANIDGFAPLVVKLRDPLNTQVQDLRSSIVKQACLAVAELSAVLAYTPWFEPLADTLIETLSKLTYVTIAVIATSAHATICTIIHNTRTGFHKVILRLLAGAKSKSSILRARCTEYLLMAVRGWAPNVLERYTNELTTIIPALICDADPTARQYARLMYWSFIHLFPNRTESILHRLDNSTQRLLSEDEETARETALYTALHGPLGKVTENILPIGNTYNGNYTNPPLSSTSSIGSIKPLSVSSGASRNYIVNSGNSTPAASNLSQTSGGFAVTNSRPGTAQSINTSTTTNNQNNTNTNSSRPTTTASRPSTASSTNKSNESTVPKNDDDSFMVTSKPVLTAKSAPHTNPSFPPSSPSRNATVTVRGLPPPGQFSTGIHSNSTLPADNEASFTDKSTVSSSFTPTLTPLQSLTNAANDILEGQHIGQLRNRILTFLVTCINIRAIDPRSIIRSYVHNERVPKELLSHLPPAILGEAAITMSTSSSSSSTTNPSNASPNMIPHAAHFSFTPYVSTAITAEGIKALLHLVSNGTVLRIIAVCIASGHDPIIQDGLVLLSTLLDTHTDTVTLGSMNLSRSALGSSISMDGTNLVHYDKPLPVLLHALFIPSTGYSSSRTITLVPVYTRILYAGGSIDDSSASSPPENTVSDLFRNVYREVLRLSRESNSTNSTNTTTAGGTTITIPVTKRALAAMRRVLPVHSLLAVTMAVLLTDTIPRLQATAVHLIRDMLSDAGASEYFASSEPRLARLFAKLGDMLHQAHTASVATGPNRALDFNNASSPFHRLPVLVDQVVLAILNARVSSNAQTIGSINYTNNPTLLVIANAMNKLAPEPLRIMIETCDAAYGGSIAALSDTIHRIRMSNGPVTSNSVMNSLPILPNVPGVPSPTKLTRASLMDLANLPSSPNAILSNVQARAPPSIPSAGRTENTSSGNNNNGTEPKIVVNAVVRPGSIAPPSLTNTGTVTMTTVPNSTTSGSIASCHVINLSRSNLELVLDTLTSSDRHKQLRALHYFGRAVDLQTAPTNSNENPHGPTNATANANPLPLHPDASTLIIPSLHRDDPIWLSLFDGVISGVLQTILTSCNTFGSGTNGPSTPSTSKDNNPPPDPLVMTQTGLSVLRKLYRNCTPYVAAKSGTCLSTVFRSIRNVPRELATVLERTAEEICDRLPLEMILPHLVTALAEEVEQSSSLSSLSSSETVHSLGSSSSNVNALSSSSTITVPTVAISILRIIARIIPRLPSGLLLTELSKGRLMEAIRKAFLSTSTDVRRGVVSVLVEIHFVLRTTSGNNAFVRYTEQYLTAPQQKLLQIYIDKAMDERR